MAKTMSTGEPSRDPRFGSPLHEAHRVESHEWEGVKFTVGDRIAFDVHARYEGDNQYDRLEGEIVELWREWWASGREELLYAECITTDGADQALRVWFHRDKVGQPTGFVGAARDEGALW